MQHRIRLDKSLITVTEDEIVHAIFELQAPPALAVERPPLDVVLVLDRSGSMAGEPLAAVCAAAKQMLRLAAPDDRIGVVAFANDVDVVLPLARHDIDVARRRVDGISVGGSTNLSGGWLKAAEMLTDSVRPGALRRIVVLTDGHANVGISDAGQLAQIVAGGHSAGVSTSLIGFADGYDEELVAALADAGHGNDYWCAGADQATAVFAAEFSGLASVVAQNISVEITPAPVVAAFDVLNDLPETPTAAGGVQIAIGDAYGDEVRRVVVRFNLRPHAEPGVLEVAELTLRWAATGDDVTLHTVRVPIAVRRGESHEIDTTADPTVTAEVTTLLAERAREAARRLADRGDFRLASRAMTDGAMLLAQVAGSAHLADEMLADAAALGREEWSAAESKKHFSQIRTTRSGRSRRFDR